MRPAAALYDVIADAPELEGRKVHSLAGAHNIRIVIFFSVQIDQKAVGMSATFYECNTRTEREKCAVISPHSLIGCGNVISKIFRDMIHVQTIYAVGTCKYQ